MKKKVFWIILIILVISFKAISSELYDPNNDSGCKNIRSDFFFHSAGTSRSVNCDIKRVKPCKIIIYKYCNTDKEAEVEYGTDLVHLILTEKEKYVIFISYTEESDEETINFIKLDKFFIPDSNQDEEYSKKKNDRLIFDINKFADMCMKK